MSSAVGSANKANLLNEESDALYDPYPWFTLNSICEIPWPEWNDAELNAEAWDEGKGGGKTAAAAVGSKSIAIAPSSVFDDPHPPKLPPAVSKYIYLWERPKEVFKNANLTVYDSSNVDFELQVPESIAPKCDFFNTLNEQLPILQFYASRYGFPVELETPNFIANTQGEAWRPWHHIYALCKAGKGQVHKPLYCPYGKYVVRLFYMGAWRRFVVDDKIPCDIEGKCLLPLTQIEGELWPIILTKALLKILSLTPTHDFSATDFSFLSALTGWTHGNFTVANKTSDQIWRRLLVLIPRYELSEKDLEIEGKALVPSAKNPIVKKESSKKESDRIFDKGEFQTEKFCFLLAHLKGIFFENNSIRDYTVAVTMIRDSPLIRATKREGTKPWKRIRWVYWAKEKGFWMDENLLPPYRRLNIITFFQKLSELLAPDPKLETVLYDIPVDNKQDLEEEELSIIEDRLYDPEQWCDYIEFLKYLSCVNVFFKPSYMSFNVKITCIKDKTTESISSGKTTTKASVPQNSFFFPPVLKNTCNEPIFLFFESLTGIFLCFSLWVHPQRAKTCLGYLDADQPKLLKIGHASLVIEQFDWRSYEQGEIIGLVKTVGYSVVGLNLKPGRHVLKLWVHSDSAYLVDISSNVNVFVRKSSRIRSLMSDESQQVLNYISNVSNAFVALSLKFGKPDLPLALRDFYNVIKPGHDGMIGYNKKLDDFIETFINSILLTLKDSIPNADELIIMMGALRSLFFNPNIQCDLPAVELPSLPYGGNNKKALKKVASIVPAITKKTLSEILNYLWTPEEIEKIITIQRIFRGYRVRLLWKYQTPGRKEFKLYTERLKKICDILFILPKRDIEVGKLLRRIVITQPDLLTTFKFYKDFANVVQVEEFTGKISNVQPFAWVPITRFVIACHSERPVPCAFYLNCNLEQFLVQGFDNDTGEEIFRITNSVSPHYYHGNVKGYTIFVFGWNEANLKTVNWRLEMVKMKHFEVIHLCNVLMNSTCHPYAMPNIEVSDLRNFYIPNSKSRICRCLIKIQKRAIMTLRLSMSYPDVHFAVIILLDPRFCSSSSESDAFGKVIATVKSTNGAVMMSSVILEYVDSILESESCPNSTVYILEAIVLDDSWPLTKQEWGLVEPMRLNGESWRASSSSLHIRKAGSESRKKLARTSKRSMSEQKVVESPSWLLQVLNDSAGPEAGEPIIVEEDKSYAEFLKTMKASWEEKDPGRKQRGKDLRMNFLYMIYLEERKRHLCYGEEYGEQTPNGNEKLEEFFDNPQCLLDRLSSFSYLVNDTSSVRYIYSPRILPKTPLCELLCKYKKMTVSVTAKPSSLRLTTMDTQSFSLECQAEMSSRVTGDMVDEMDEDRKDFLIQCLHYRFVMANHMNEEQKLSNQLMEEAYVGRLKAIERLMR